jgi:hypothetical protein
MVFEIVFKKGGGSECIECFESSLCRRIWNACFPAPQWVRDCENALKQDTSDREALYQEWVATLTGGVR